MEKRLNVEISKTVSEFEQLMKEFLIRNVLYRIIFRGKGLEFDSYRDYSPSEDASDIDWKASKKANKLLVKQFIEERDLKILFVVDVSENMLFGSTEKLKCEYATELSAALAHLIITSNDNVGFVLFSDKIVQNALPKKGIKQFQLFVDEMSKAENYSGDSELPRILEFLLNYLSKSINSVIIISDFLRIKQDSLKTFELFSDRFETLAIMIKDPLDKTLPNIKGEFVVQNPVSKEQIVIDPSVARKKYEKYALQQEEIAKNILDKSGIDLLELTTDRPIAPNLAEFLKERMKKKKYIIPQK